MKLFSPAKINIELHIGEILDSGMHELSTYVRHIDFGDILSIDDSHTFSIEGMPQIPEKENLIYKAYTNFCTHINVNITPAFSIQKNIPIGSGLGGGSSNYATTLKLLSRYYKLEKEFAKHKTDIFLQATKDTSDSLLFLQDSSCLQMENNKIETKTCEDQQEKILVIFPPFCNSSKLAYRYYDAIRDSKQRVNDFDIFLETEPYSKKNNILSENCSAIHLCGSGSAIWAYLEDINDATTLFNTLKQLKYFYVTARFL